MSKNLIPHLTADILIIDDTPDNLRLLNQILSQHYKVRLAPNADIGLKAARSTPPDLILLDVMMPGMNGYEVAVKLKADELTAEIPIIFISALDDTESKVRGFNAGGVDYVTKPFQEREVLARVNTHLSLRALYLQAQTEISERKQVEESLRKREQEYKTLVENTPDVIARFDRQYRHMYVNPAVEKEFGVSPEKLLGKTHRELGQPPEIADWSENIMRQVFETGQEIVFELTIPTPAGNKHYLSRGVPEFAEDGSITSVLIIHRNITERQQAEKALQESEARFRALIESAPVAIALGRDGKFLYANQMYAKVHGLTSIDELIGRPILERVAPQCRDASIERSRRRNQGLPTETQYELIGLRLDGTEFPMIATVAQVNLADGSANIGFFQDITDRKQAEEHIRQLSRAVEASPTSIVITDLKGDIQYVNPKFTEVTGYSPSEVIGKNPRILKSGQTPPEVHIELWDTVPNGKEWHGEFCNRKKNGELYWESASISPITDGNGVITHYVAVKEDITERKKTETALRQSEEKYRTVANFTYDWEAWRAPDNTYIYISPSCERITGHSAIEFTSNPDLLLQITHPDDKHKITEHLEAVTHDDRIENLLLDFRIITPKGETRWIEHSCVAVHGESGQWLGRRESNRDITERKRAEEREREQRTLAESLRDTAEALNSSLQLDDILDKILDNVERVVPYDAMTVAWIEEERISILRRRGYHTGQEHVDDKQSFAANQIPTFAQTIETRQPLVIPDVKSSPIWITSPQTEWVRSHIKAPIIIDDKVAGIINLHSKTPGFYNETHAGNLQIFANQVAIAARNAQLYQEIQHLAIYDPLTGLHNRRYMEEALTREYARATRTNEPLSVVMIDIDGLKKFNDTYGHDVGDQAIKTFADQIKLMTRTEDVACRYGGDEFLVILYNTDIETASKRVEEWQERVSNAGFPHQGTSLHVDFSAGVATYPIHGASIEEVVKAADKALYEKKRTNKHEEPTSNDGTGERVSRRQPPRN